MSDGDRSASGRRAWVLPAGLVALSFVALSLVRTTRFLAMPMPVMAALAFASADS